MYKISIQWQQNCRRNSRHKIFYRVTTFNIYLKKKLVLQGIKSTVGKEDFKVAYGQTFLKLLNSPVKISVQADLYESQAGDFATYSINLCPLLS